MMEWTDRHCRFFHRLMTRRALLYTEMVTTGAVLHGDRAQLIGFDPFEHPVALQLGGSDPRALAQCARIAQDLGYDEINLNVGCPSDRVQEGRFGACLMAEPDHVGECVAAMKAQVTVPVTVKCRIGIDDRDDYEFFAAFVDGVAAAGIDALIVHARAAVLAGLSPKQNREIPPLKYEHVFRLKRERPELTVILNGGMSDRTEVCALLNAGLDGAMLGRAAYHRPALLAELEQDLLDPAWVLPEPWQIVERLVPYAKRCAQRGIRLHSITRHMHGVMAGREGARAWRRFLSEVAARPEALPETLFSALPLTNQGLAA